MPTNKVPALSHGVEDIATQQAIARLEQFANEVISRLNALETRATALETKLTAYIGTHP